MIPRAVTMPAILDAASTRKDRSIKLVFETQEMSAEVAAALFSMRQMQGWLLFSPNTIQEENIPDEKAELDEGKSPSKRLRSVLFILWKQRGKQGDFETYYRAQIERLIDQIKEKLE